jgi:acetyl esterase/lipase
MLKTLVELFYSLKCSPAEILASHALPSIAFIVVVLIVQVDNATSGLPVMVYIHGGSFILGSAQEFWPNYLLEKDIVLVVPQYRLGLLGKSRYEFTFHALHCFTLL